MKEIIGWAKRKNKTLKKKRHTCSNCAAIYTYEDADIQKYSGRDTSGGPDGRWWLVCPNCQAEHMQRQHSQANIGRYHSPDYSCGLHEAEKTLKEMEVNADEYVELIQERDALRARVAELESTIAQMDY